MGRLGSRRRGATFPWALAVVTAIALLRPSWIAAGVMAVAQWWDAAITPVVVAIMVGH